jgi:hypothetical protein
MLTPSEPKIIKMTTKQLKQLKESFDIAKTTNEENFEKEVKLFLYNILSDSKQNISDFWKLNGLTNSDVLRLLSRFGVIIKNDENKIMIPKNNFDRKVKRLYWHLFPDKDYIITEDGEGNTAGGVGGSFEAPFTTIQRRTFANN